ncbi:MAG TPA: hypothetical protein VEU96_08570 [Bryobacteraceae bacterium]|nr:hypothetical protein [Bryobacteraceae bacterium]
MKELGAAMIILLVSLVLFSRVTPGYPGAPLAQRLAAEISAIAHIR